MANHTRPLLTTKYVTAAAVTAGRSETAGANGDVGVGLMPAHCRTSHAAPRLAVY
jgi:hypothetical protein